MRTTIDLPDDLIREAMKVSHHNTKTGVIIAALEDLIRKSNLQKLKRYRGKVDLDIDLNALRKRV